MRLCCTYARLHAASDLVGLRSSLFPFPQALQKLHEMAFVPLEKARVEHCVRAAQTALHLTVQERLQDVLGIAADTISAQKVSARLVGCEGGRK